MSEDRLPLGEMVRSAVPPFFQGEVPFFVSYQKMVPPEVRLERGGMVGDETIIYDGSEPGSVTTVPD